jgi:hypothetical protein
MSNSPSLGELIHQQLRPGILPEKKVAAIKALRDAGSLGLKEAKDAVEIITETTHENIGSQMAKLFVILRHARFQLPPDQLQFVDALNNADFPEYRICEFTRAVFPNADTDLVVDRIRLLRDNPKLPDWNA